MIEDTMFIYSSVSDIFVFYLINQIKKLISVLKYYLFIYILNCFCLEFNQCQRT